MKLNEITPNKDQRAAIIGRTGSGKSYLARQLIKGSGRDLVVIDPKNQFELKRDCEIITNFKGFKRNFKKKPVIYRPSPTEFLQLDQYDEIFRECYDKGNVTIYIDDLTGIVTPTKYPHFLNVCYTMGRSHNVRIISAFQRPSRLPLFTMSEANRFYCFGLNLRDDVKRIQEFVPGYEPKNLERYAFYYYDDETMSQAKDLIL